MCIRDRVYLGVTGIAHLLAIPMGCFEYDVYWGVSRAIVDLIGPVEGLIIGICFLSPLADKFEVAQNRIE